MRNLGSYSVPLPSPWSQDGDPRLCTRVLSGPLFARNHSLQGGIEHPWPPPPSPRQALGWSERSEGSGAGVPRPVGRETGSQSRRAGGGGQGRAPSSRGLGGARNSARLCGCGGERGTQKLCLPLPGALVRAPGLALLAARTPAAQGPRRAVPRASRRPPASPTDLGKARTAARASPGAVHSEPPAQPRPAGWRRPPRRPGAQSSPPPRLII